MVPRNSFIVFLLLFSGLACVVVLSYLVRWHFTCFAHYFAIVFVFVFLSPSLRPQNYYHGISLG